MERNTYKYLTSFETDYVQTEARTTPVWISNKYVAWMGLEESLKTVEFREDFYNIVEGAANLINVIEERHATGAPIKTLLYLDKSGRLASYILHVMYTTLAEQYGPKGEAIASHKPNIRYVNISSFSYETRHDKQTMKKLLGHLYRAEDLQEDSTLIVDEIMMSGVTTKVAAQIFRNAEFGQQFQAISQHHDCPRWYGRNEVKGVDDIDGISNETTQCMENLLHNDPDTYWRLTSYVRTYGWQPLYDATFQEQDEPNESDIPQQVTSDIRANTKDASEISEAIQYLASYGGFLALAPSKYTLKQSNLYRNNLKAMIQEAFRRKLIKIKRK